MTAEEYLALVKDARAMVITLRMVPDDQEADWLAAALEEWANATERWVHEDVGS